MGLLALAVVALEYTVEAQPLKPPYSSEQALRNAAFDGQSIAPSTVKPTGNFSGSCKRNIRPAGERSGLRIRGSGNISILCNPPAMQLELRLTALRPLDRMARALRKQGHK